KTVGVVIPIYNVQDYLKECLDSVINQTYKNLQIVLVNDGSTDENSLNIAKEYTLKDERFILFDKKNGGLSSARNVGIEYFSKEYKLKNITNDIKENSLIEFDLDGNNPYEIYKVYKSSKFFKNKDELLNFKTPDIDYIIFLDSDDYWELNCIEECVPRMDGVEVVWFNYRPFFQKVKKKNYKTQMDYFDFKDEKIITSKEWLHRVKKNNIFYFWFAWQGMIDFNFLRKIDLKFIDGIFAEDCHFGVLLFALNSKIYIYPEKKYIYRLRSGSLMNFTNKKNKIHFSSYLKKFDVFNDEEKAKEYHKALSWFKIALEFLNYAKNHNNPFSKEIEELFLPVVCNKALHLKNFKEYLVDKSSILELEKYIQNQPLGAVSRAKEYLSYKIAKKISTSKGIKKFLLPFSAIYVVLKHQKEIIKRKKSHKKLPLEFYKDYQKAIRLRKILFKNF
ncbi:glycosyltransferase family 2 protein, partial [Campylobacter estrildidarum]